ncbi:hypothetical protein SAMN05660489_01955 [Pseudomonas sp. LAMO17WK12:I10]|uniref:DUF6515 family protein n=1 Tax=unclassified Pseudomonas TaxID=196821 RepID=UPI000BCDA1E6|nr:MULTISPECIES: DUF6515 family protein [unclassified Pseudomonas]PXX73483.1 hypothetical protein H160_01924 [Pseudomonas sp. LAMO17WK12:I9]SNY24798.1 hypothetical protein SAMN05660489_01955 [Pseudomonas sp. LAMO17WK12:I10]
MKSRIWRLAGVGLLCVSVSAQGLADDRNDGRGWSNGGQRSDDGYPGNGQGRGESHQSRPQTEIIRGDNSQQFERNVENGRWQNHGPNDQGRERQAQPSANLPIQGRPDTVRQTQEPRQGYYQDIPRRNDYNPHWQAGGPGSRPYDYRWPGRPEGRGNGWGPGPQYRPGYVIDRFPDRHDRVPYRGRDYYFSGGYWYRPEGPRYVVVRPPYGIRVAYLPDYAREVWIGSALFFLAAGAYYSYEASTQQYVVVEPPVASPPPQTGNDYNVLAYPVSGQSPQQINQDRYDCYRWAVQQSGFDPAAMTYPPAPQVVQTYRQAQGGCLSSRGYQVTY